MKRMIRSSASAENLFDRLSDDLSNTFEDNVAMKYAKYDESDTVDRTTQKAIFNRYTKARMDYLKAVEQLIRKVDVNDFI